MNSFDLEALVCADLDEILELEECWDAEDRCDDATEGA